MDTISQDDSNYWKKCSVCKQQIGFEAPYQVCSVSTCQRKRTGLTFCSVDCWDAHLGFANHRSSSAEERYAPSKAAYQQELAAEQSHAEPASAPTPVRRLVSTPSANSGKRIKTDTLVVVSKVKQLIKEQSGFSTSQCGIDALTEKVIQECLKGMEVAQQAGRKTVMGRDIE